MLTSTLKSLFLLAIACHASPTPQSFQNAEHTKRDDAFEWGPSMENANNPGWMATIPDSTNIAKMSIPGTHDTMTFGFSGPGIFAGPIVTQRANLEVQYNAGIRFVDMRLHYENGVFTMHHGLAYLNSNFADVLKITASFLSQNPSETILMRVKHETEGGSDGNGGVSFADRMREYMTTNEGTKDIFAKYQYNSGDGSTLPDLGQVRGKFVMFNEFPGAPAEWGFQYPTSGGKMLENNLMNIADDYDIDDFQFTQKWNSILDHLNAAKGADWASEKRMFVTFMSAAHFPATTPLEIAMGKTVSTVIGGSKQVPGMNTRAYGTLLEWGLGWRAGVVVMDFPGPGLIWRIIELNKQPQ